MIKPMMSDAELMRRLGAHPELRGGIESLVLAVEDECGELKTADAAEMRVIEMMRRTGRDALQSWAQYPPSKGPRKSANKPAAYGARVKKL